MKEGPKTLYPLSVSTGEGWVRLWLDEIDVELLADSVLELMRRLELETSLRDWLGYAMGSEK